MSMYELFPTIFEARIAQQVRQWQEQHNSEFDMTQKYIAIYRWNIPASESKVEYDYGFVYSKNKDDLRNKCEETLKKSPKSTKIGAIWICEWANTRSALALDFGVEVAGDPARPLALLGNIRRRAGVKPRLVYRSERVKERKPHISLLPKLDSNVRYYPPIPIKPLGPIYKPNYSIEVAPKDL